MPTVTSIPCVLQVLTVVRSDDLKCQPIQKPRNGIKSKPPVTRRRHGHQLCLSDWRLSFKLQETRRRLASRNNQRRHGSKIWQLAGKIA
ncbi:hypothetical protein R1flu_011291 [Riccia fluitans]|uniref:Secreted protein n=1 Tax=Riccia fluitans TaxID=41844 RepID=A0ABD1Z8H9_9MARC